MYIYLCMYKVCIPYELDCEVMNQHESTEDDYPNSESNTDENYEHE